MRKRIHAHLGAELEKYPNFDFDGLFSAIGVKEGASEYLHLDWNDPWNRHALVFAAGTYEGGDFCVPQMRGRMRFLPGSVLAARARALAHASTPFTGRRLVFTCFIDNTLLEHTLQQDQYFRFV